MDYFRCPSIITAVLLYYHGSHKKQKSVKFTKIPSGVPQQQRPRQDNEDLSTNYSYDYSYGYPQEYLSEDREYRPNEARHEVEQKPQMNQMRQELAALWQYYDPNMNLIQYCNDGNVYTRDQYGNFLGCRPIIPEEYQRIFYPQQNQY